MTARRAFALSEGFRGQGLLSSPRQVPQSYTRSRLGGTDASAFLWTSILIVKELLQVFAVDMEASNKSILFCTASSGRYARAAEGFVFPWQQEPPTSKASVILALV